VGQFPEWAFAAKRITSEYAVIQAQSPMYKQWPHLWLADSPLFARRPMEVV
jgi:hypothetical protein